MADFQEVSLQNCDVDVSVFAPFCLSDPPKVFDKDPIKIGSRGHAQFEFLPIPIPVLGISMFVTVLPNKFDNPENAKPWRQELP